MSGWTFSFTWTVSQWFASGFPAVKFEVRWIEKTFETCRLSAVVIWLLGCFLRSTFPAGKKEMTRDPRCHSLTCAWWRVLWFHLTCSRRRDESFVVRIRMSRSVWRQLCSCSNTGAPRGKFELSQCLGVHQPRRNVSTWAWTDFDHSRSCACREADAETKARMGTFRTLSLFSGDSTCLRNTSGNAMFVILQVVMRRGGTNFVTKPHAPIMILNGEASTACETHLFRDLFTEQRC